MIEKVITNRKKAQDAGVYLPCPRCGKLCMDEESATLNALSRRAGVYICDKCGEKLTGINHHKIIVNTKKRWDLCLSCLKDVEKYIERSVNI